MTKKWQSHEIKRLAEIYPYVENEVIARILSRSVQSVGKKARSLGLSKDKEVFGMMRAIWSAGDKNPKWKGGKTYNYSGYVYVLDKDNPEANEKGYIFEHRKVMREHIGRELEKHEVVHHINGIRDDNRIENLELLSRGEHTAFHHTGATHSDETKMKMSKSAVLVWRERLENRKTQLNKLEELR